MPEDGNRPTPYAHSSGAATTELWQSLDEHAVGVAALAQVFACSFNSSGWAKLIALLHDVGKSRRAFQNYLLKASNLAYEGDTSERSHSGAGAAWAVSQTWPRFGKLPIGRILAYCIAGHHAGLPDWIGGESPNGALRVRLDSDESVLQEQEVADWIAAHEDEWKSVELSLPWKFKPNSTDVSFWIRMLYSCLVDADFLDTERFMDGKASKNRGSHAGLSEMAPKLFAFLEAMERKAQKTEVNAIRAAIRRQCESAGSRPVGLHSLAVPTGGGKTLAAMTFAFRHALAHGLKRIVYVIPYTSIIEQTADVLRKVFGDDEVVEHHSNLDPEKETESSRLATENWDTPIIVTTSVQFFESLYACRSSRCRKLHNLAESVVILDEVQLLPPELLWPCTEALAQLVSHYRMTVLLSTATQTALALAGPLSGVRISPIIADETSLYEKLKRVKIELPDPCPRREWDSLAQELSECPQVLCIVNSKKDCRALADRLDPESTFYLTTNLCGAHRSRRIEEIKRRLDAGEKVRVVSTQLMEAGVDVDFPIVYRAFTGYSSIVQAAGRCNREGKLPQPGRVVVFAPPEPSPVGTLRKAEDAMRNLMSQGVVSFDDPETSRRFFKTYYERQNEDGGEEFKAFLVKGVSRFEFQFREAASRFKMIPDDTVPVIVRYGESGALIDEYRTIGRPTRKVMRKLQRHVVNVHRSRLVSLVENGLVEELPPEGSGLYVQTTASFYSERFGFELDSTGLSVEECIC